MQDLNMMIPKYEFPESDNDDTEDDKMILNP
jgi:hypothetical protein